MQGSLPSGKALVWTGVTPQLSKSSRHLSLQLLNYVDLASLRTRFGRYIIATMHTPTTTLRDATCNHAKHHTGHHAIIKPLTTSNRLVRLLHTTLVGLWGYLLRHTTLFESSKCAPTPPLGRCAWLFGSQWQLVQLVACSTHMRHPLPTLSNQGPRRIWSTCGWGQQSAALLWVRCRFGVHVAPAICRVAKVQPCQSWLLPARACTCVWPSASEGF